MDLGGIVQLVSLKLGEQVLFYPRDECIRGGINPALRLMCMVFPEMLRQRVTYTVNADLPFIDLRTIVDSNGVLLGNRIRKVRRIMLGDVSADAPTRSAATGELVELRKTTLAKLSSRNDWMRKQGQIRHYWQWGPYWLGLHKRPIATTTITLVYDAVPATLVNDADVPQVPAVYHREIAEISMGCLLAKEGNPEGLRGLQKLIDGLQQKKQGTVA